MLLIQIEIVKYSIFYYLINAIIIISQLIGFQAHSKENFALFGILLFQLCWSLALIFISCDLCEKTSDAYNEIDYEISQLDWYLLPFAVKKLLPIIIMNAQKEVKFECFGTVISGDRDAFKKVCKIFSSILSSNR